MQVTEPIRTTRAGWDVLYRKHHDESYLLLGVVTSGGISCIRWDTLQMKPCGRDLRMPKEQEERLRTVWLEYLRGQSVKRLPRRLQWGSFGIYGSVPVYDRDSEAIAVKVKGILESIEVGLQVFEA